MLGVLYGTTLCFGVLFGRQAVRAWRARRRKTCALWSLALVVALVSSILATLGAALPVLPARSYRLMEAYRGTHEVATIEKTIDRHRTLRVSMTEDNIQLLRFFNEPSCVRQWPQWPVAPV